MAEDIAQYTISEYYANMSEDILRTKRPDILACGLSVGFIASTKKKMYGKTKAVLGECKKVSDLHRLFCPYDFLIIIYEPNCEGLRDDQMEILLWHELEHIGIDDEGEGYLVPHDVEEFDKIISAHGLHWETDVPRGTIGGEINGEG